MGKVSWNYKNLVGQRFGELVVRNREKNDKKGNTYWLCECDCGNFTKIRGTHLKSGDIQSCGCHGRKRLLGKPATHGHCINGKESKTYSAWVSMCGRCNNSKDNGYKNYGGRGISVCIPWLKFENFLRDMGEAPQGLMIERIDNNGDYTPNNCKWATRLEQMRNNRHVKLNVLKVQVIKKLLKESKLRQHEIAEIFGVGRHAIGNINTGRTWNNIVYSEML